MSWYSQVTVSQSRTGGAAAPGPACPSRNHTDKRVWPAEYPGTQVPGYMYSEEAVFPGVPGYPYPGIELYSKKALLGYPGYAQATATVV
eukprot:1344828-Rhodomonas_salina.1